MWAIVSKNRKICYTLSGAAVFQCKAEAVAAHVKESMCIDGQGQLYTTRPGAWKRMRKDGYTCAQVVVIMRTEDNYGVELGRR